MSSTRCGMPTSRGELAAANRPRASNERDGFGADSPRADGKIRKTIAANMVRSANTIPHLTNFDDADITELERIRKGSTAAYATTQASS